MVNERNNLKFGLLPAPGSPPVEWRVSDRLVDYDTALATMIDRADAIARGEAPELVWLLEHPPLYTAGTSAQPQELIEARFPVHVAGRGGQFTYHGPGQRVAYVMLDLKRRTPDVRRFVATLEEWIIRTLGAFNVRGERREDRIGVWVRRPEKGEGFEDKIAAIGIRIRHWVTLHGIALNVEPDLSHFSGIVPCGVSEPRFGVTSLADLGLMVTMPEIDMILRQRIRGAVWRDTGRRRPSDRRQYREAFAAAAQREIVGGTVALIDLVDARAGRPVVARRDHCGDGFFRSCEHRLDYAIAAVACPAFEATFERRVFGPGAESDALHPAADEHVADHCHPNSPSLRALAPRGRIGSHRCSEAM